MSLFTASLYLLCIAFLFGSALFVFSRDPLARLNIYYTILAFGLLGWVATLFVFNTTVAPANLLWLGRLNFAFVPVVATASYLFVRELSRNGPDRASWLWIETIFIAVLAATTGLIDKAELLVGGQHITQYGPLFVPYVVQIVGFLAAAIVGAYRPASRVPSDRRLQLRVIGTGILLTLVVASVTNALLPYIAGNFDYINVGTLSSVFFLGAIAYATISQHLFNIRVIITKTLITAILVGIALEIYQASVSFLAQLLPLKAPVSRGLAAAVVVLVINALLQEHVKEWLERIANRLMLGTRRNHRITQN